MQAKLLIDSKNTLGEGPLWDAESQEFLWVDIEECLLNFYSPETGNITQYTMPSRIGTVAVITSSLRYIVALQNGLFYFDRNDKTFEFITDPEPDIPNNRFNDGKLDPQGRLWVGTMDLGAKANSGKLYMLDKCGKLHTKLEGLSISNGMDWDVENKIFYFIDTADYCVYRFDYDDATGDITNKRIAIQIPVSHGAPDGMCRDANGMLWIAHWGGNKVSQWNPQTGELIQNVNIPAPQVTSCSIGGVNNDKLFVTSARIGMCADELEKYPLSGGVFVLQL